MIRALLGAHGENVKDLCDVLDLADTQIGKRLKGTIPWRAHELAAVAEHFGVPVGTLYRDPTELLKTSLYKCETPSDLPVSSPVELVSSREKPDQRFRETVNRPLLMPV